LDCCLCPISNGKRSEVIGSVKVKLFFKGINFLCTKNMNFFRYSFLWMEIVFKVVADVIVVAAVETVVVGGGMADVDVDS